MSVCCLRQQLNSFYILFTPNYEIYSPHKRYAFSHTKFPSLYVYIVPCKHGALVLDLVRQQTFSENVEFYFECKCAAAAADAVIYMFLCSTTVQSLL